MTVRPDRTKWRDQKISERHRLWGFDVPIVDIDFLVVEYDYGVPKALIEYKNEHAEINFEKITETSAAPQSYKALNILADNSQIPFFIVIYTDNMKQYYVIPKNKYAERYVKTEKLLIETQYVEFLYQIRGRNIPIDIIKKISSGDLSYYSSF